MTKEQICECCNKKGIDEGEILEFMREFHRKYIMGIKVSGLDYEEELSRALSAKFSQPVVDEEEFNKIILKYWKSDFEQMSLKDIYKAIINSMGKGGNDGYYSDVAGLNKKGE